MGTPKQQGSVDSGQPPAVSGQQPAAGGQPSAVGRQPSAGGQRPTTTDHPPTANGHRLPSLLSFLYGPERGQAAFRQIQALMEAWRPRMERWEPERPLFSHEDVLVIAYGGHILPPEPGTPKLHGLRRFLETYAHPGVNGVHILPFFPYSSDDGFSVIDYLQVRPDLGTWEDVEAIARRFHLMVDLVLNHASRKSPWFQAFLRGDPEYEDFFLTVENPHDPAWAHVVRPRTTPLFTPVETAQGRRYVWTTFSPDQVDLNYHNPKVLLRMVEVLLHYIAHGARVIRMDAVAYAWKEPYTPCIHLPQAHALVKVFRAVVDAVAPWVRIITETNVPHEENVAYFGDGTDEAHLVYNFTLPPLTLHAFLTGDASILTRWAATLETPGPQTAFFNFLASHDGIGVTPADGWLNPAQMEALYRTVLEHGGLLSYKALPGGGRRVYELNITWYDALNDPCCPTPLDVPRFLASQAVMLSLAGVPGIYLPSLFGARNCLPCVEEKGYPRAINREKFSWEALRQALENPRDHRAQVFQGYRRLLNLRRKVDAFHPAAAQRVLDLGPGLFAVERLGANTHLLALISVRGRSQRVVAPDFPGLWKDLLTGETLEPAAGLLLAPYQVRWLMRI